MSRIKRTLDGAEIDEITADVQTRKALAIERRRRADWRKRQLAAVGFEAGCDRVDAAPLPHRDHDQVT